MIKLVTLVMTIFSLIVSTSADSNTPRAY
jgi:hypothetical protein